MYEIEKIWEDSACVRDREDLERLGRSGQLKIELMIAATISKLVSKANKTCKLIVCK